MPPSVVLISSRYDVLHDDVFVRDELRSLLADAGCPEPALAPDYASASLEGASLLVTYIARQPPGRPETETLRRFLERGGSWLAIHTTNAVPESCPLPEVLGSRFLTHPPYGTFVVDVASPEDALVQGFEPFVVEDELYIIEAAADIEVLLTARWGGTAPNGMRIPERDQPLMYRRRIGDGEVVYLALGHTNPEGVIVRGEKVGERRGAWDSPVFREVLHRAITRAL